MANGGPGTSRRTLGLALFAVLAALGVAAALHFRRARVPGNPYAVDLGPFRKVDPTLVRYREEGSFDVPLERLLALAAAADGSVLVSGGSSDGGALIRFGPDGEVRHRRRSEPPPRCLAAGPEGEVYLGMRDHVEVLPAGDLSAAAESWVPVGEKAFLLSLAADAEDVFAADGGQRLVWRFDRRGTLRGVIGRQRTPAENEGFLLPGPCFDVVLDPRGELWIVNPGRHRVEHRTREGRRLGSWGAYGFGIERFSGC